MDQPEKKGKNRLLRFFWGLFPWLIVILIILFSVYMGFRLKNEKARLEEAKIAAMEKEIPAVKVITLTLKPEELEDKLDLPAEVEPFEDILVKAEVPGKIVKVLIEEGQDVHLYYSNEKGMV